MNFLQQIGFGGFPMTGFGGGFPMGAQFLMGNPMGGGFGMPMGDPFTMYQMMQQFFAQQPQQGQQGQNAWQAFQGQQANDRPTFQPDRNQSPYEQMQALRTFANANGSRDGTPVADWTTPNEDVGAGNYLTGLMDRQGDVLINELRHASPEEKALLKAEEEKLVALEQQRKDDGRPMSGREKMTYQNQYTERLYSEGKLNDRLGMANRELIEISRYGDQTFANMFLKNGAPVPPDMPQEFIQNSPYNRNRPQQQAA